MNKKNMLLYFFLLLLSFLFVYFYGGKIPYVFFYTILSLPVISCIHTIMLFCMFKHVQYISKSTAIKGESINYTFTAYNNSFIIFPHIRLIFNKEGAVFSQQLEAKNLSLPPFSKKTFMSELQCNYRGSYELGIDTIEFENFLGIFKLIHSKGLSKIKLTVNPRIINLEKFNLKYNYLADTCSVLSYRNEDMNTVSEYKKYSYGDSLKNVNWKLSAKTRHIMVKKYQSTSKLSTLIFLDLKKNPYSYETNLIIEDKVIEATIAVLHYCLMKWIPVKFICHNKELTIFNADNSSAFNKLYSFLSNVKFSTNVDIKDVMEVCLTDNMHNTNIIVFTSNIDIELYDRISKANIHGHQVSLVYISPYHITDKTNTNEDSILSQLPDIGVSLFRININDDIKDILETNC